MPAMQLEVEKLSGIDLEGSPTCDIWEDPDHVQRCGHAAAFRVWITCSECSYHGTGFICVVCHILLRNEGLQCPLCMSVDYEWGNL